MGTCRASAGLILGTKRRALEKTILDAGHVWAREPRVGVPWTGLECVELYLGYLDELADPEGNIPSLDEVEFYAQWTGAEGLLVKALLAVRFIDKLSGGRYRWHDFKSYNGRAIRARLRQRKHRGDDLPLEDAEGETVEPKRDRGRDKKRDSGRDKVGSPSPSPSPEKILRGSSPPEDDGAPKGAVGNVAREAEKKEPPRRRHRDLWEAPGAVDAEGFALPAHPEQAEAERVISAAKRTGQPFDRPKWSPARQS